MQSRVPDRTAILQVWANNGFILMEDIGEKGIEIGEMGRKYRTNKLWTIRAIKVYHRSIKKQLRKNETNKNDQK